MSDTRKLAAEMVEAVLRRRHSAARLASLEEERDNLRRQLDEASSRVMSWGPLIARAEAATRAPLTFAEGGISGPSPAGCEPSGGHSPRVVLRAKTPDLDLDAELDRMRAAEAVQ